MHDKEGDMSGYGTSSVSCTTRSSSSSTSPVYLLLFWDMLWMVMMLCRGRTTTLRVLCDCEDTESVLLSLTIFFPGPKLRTHATLPCVLYTDWSILNNNSHPRFTLPKMRTKWRYELEPGDLKLGKRLINLHYSLQWKEEKQKKVTKKRRKKRLIRSIQLLLHTRELSKEDY